MQHLLFLHHILYIFLPFHFVQTELHLWFKFTHVLCDRWLHLSNISPQGGSGVRIFSTCSFCSKSCTFFLLLNLVCCWSSTSALNQSSGWLVQTSAIFWHLMFCLYSGTCRFFETWGKNSSFVGLGSPDIILINFNMTLSMRWECDEGPHEVEQ